VPFLFAGKFSEKFFRKFCTYSSGAWISSIGIRLRRGRYFQVESGSFQNFEILYGVRVALPDRPPPGEP
jgi:hypothetical protein